MARVQSSLDLRNNYNEISKFCHENCETVFITENGQEDLVVMSMKTYEIISGKFELYHLLDEGRNSLKRPYRDVFREIEQEIIGEMNDERL